MINKEQNNKNFQTLIEKYLDGKTTLEEVKKLVNYYESFQENNEWVEDLGSKKTIKNRMLISILEAIQEEEVKIIPFYRRNIFRYGVAASIILFIAFNFVFNKSNPLINDPIHTFSNTNNTIEIGRDKAILTLENGSKVALEKGQNYITNNVNSNGKLLIYTPKPDANTEISYNYLTIPRGGQYMVKLSDGTQVWLNSESQLKYPVAFLENKTREVELIYGEAYFDVSPSTKHNGSKFKVLHKPQEIEVLGTEFNVKAYKDENFIYTTLIEGKVMVDNILNPYILKPNEQSVLNKENKNIIVTNVDVYSEIAWKKGLFSFKDKSLKSIMKTLSRWYDVNVIFTDKELEDVKFKGVLSKNQTIEEILALIKNTNFIKTYEIKNKTVILKN